MPIRVKCDSCKKTLSVKDQLAGKRIKCPVCQTVVAVPAAPPGKAPVPTAAPAPKPGTAPDKKPATAPKVGLSVKSPVDKTKTNGTPAQRAAHSVAECYRSAQCTGPSLRARKGSPVRACTRHSATHDIFARRRIPRWTSR